VEAALGGSERQELQVEREGVEVDGHDDSAEEGSARNHRLQKSPAFERGAGELPAERKEQDPPEVSLHERAQPRHRPSKASAASDCARSPTKIDHIARAEKKWRIGSLEIWRERATCMTSAARRSAAVTDTKWLQSIARMER
jgi:hypothetical protein